MRRHAGYVPLSALTVPERQEYLALLREKMRQYPALYSSEAARAGLRARIFNARSTADAIELASFGGVRPRRS